MVPAGTPGFTVEPAYRKLGWHASDTHGLSFADCRVPAGNLLGERGRGFSQFLAILDDGRIAITALAVGLAQACLDACLDYAGSRQAFGRPIGVNQGVAFPIADLAVAVEAARLLTYKAAWLRDEQAAGRRGAGEVKQAAALAKLHSPEAAVDATRLATQVFGGAGFIEEYPRRPLLPRRQDPRDRRGHERGAAHGHRPRPRPARSPDARRCRLGVD